MKKTATGKLNVFITSDFSFGRLKEAKTDEEVFSCVCVTSESMTNIPEWSMIGQAEVNIEFFDETLIFEKKIESVKAEIRKVQADAELNVNHLKEKLSQLQAISYAPEGVV